VRLLVVGGAGYVGSHMVKRLLAAGCEVVTLDNLSSGRRDAVMGGQFVEGDVGSPAVLDRVFAQHRVQGVLHFASNIQVEESVRAPARYYRNNVVDTLALLDAMLRHDVRRLVFSSTAAVYGDPQYTPIDEQHPKNPLNPYGRSKWMVEQILADYDRAYGLKSIALRYFNAAGADPESEIGERHDPETHLVPLVLQAASGRRGSITVHGRDYDTPDGTCVRDYVHVADLADAHLLALEWLIEGGGTRAYNLGSESGFSVREVIDTAMRVTGRPIPVVYGPRRPGDSPRLVASAARARDELGWTRRYTELETLIRHAWAWELRQAAAG
jgi:UDP-glucose 4-epimerase